MIQLITDIKEHGFMPQMFHVVFCLLKFCFSLLYLLEPFQTAEAITDDCVQYNKSTHTASAPLLCYVLDWHCKSGMAKVAKD